MADRYLKPVWDYINNAPRSVQYVLGAASLYAIYYVLIKKKYKLPPGPRALPIVGNLLALREDTLVEKLKKWAKDYGPISTVYLGPLRTIVISDIDLMLEALVTRGSDFSGRPFIYSMHLMSEGSKNISSAPYGDTWKYQRKVASQSLRQFLTGQQFEERVNEVLKLVIKEIEAKNDPFELRDILSLTVFNVLHGLCFGSTSNFDDPSFKRIVNIVDEFTVDAGNGFLEDIFPPLRLWPTKTFTNTMEKLFWLVDYTKQQIKKCKANFNRDSIRCLTDNVLLTQKELMETDSGALAHMTDTHAAQIIFDVFGAGVDTSRSTLDWIFLVLITYPDIQARMHKEIDEVVGEKVVGKDHRSKLVYCEAVILETMRLYAVAPLSVPHETMCDTSVGGYEIPAKTNVFINQHLILRDPKHWEDSMTFKPERFMNQDETKISVRNRSFIPFSAGHRSCPGESLAKLNIVYIVVGLLQKLSFSLPPGEKADFTPNTDFFGFRAPVYKVVAKFR